MNNKAYHIGGKRTIKHHIGGKTKEFSMSKTQSTETKLSKMIISFTNRIQRELKGKAWFSIKIATGNCTQSAETKEKIGDFRKRMKAEIRDEIKAKTEKKPVKKAAPKEAVAMSTVTKAAKAPKKTKATPAKKSPSKFKSIAKVAAKKASVKNAPKKAKSTTKTSKKK